jgi:hypothetical protein
MYLFAKLSAFLMIIRANVMPEKMLHQETDDSSTISFVNIAVEFRRCSEVFELKCCGRRMLVAAGT